MRSIHQSAELLCASAGFQNIDRAEDPVIFADDVRGAATKKRIELWAGSVQLGQSYFAQACHAESARRRRAFGPPLIVKAVEKIVRSTRLGDHHCQSSWQRNGSDLVAQKIEVDDMIGPAENRSGLIKQAGLHADEIVLGALAKPGDRERIDAEIVERHEETGRRHLERRGAREAGARCNIAGNFRGESANFVTGGAELFHDPKGVIGPALAGSRPQIG